MTKEYDDAVASLGATLRASEEHRPAGEKNPATEKLVAQMEASHATVTGRRWGWSAHRSPDKWLGSFLTREAAIQDAKEHSWKTFFVNSGTCPDGKRFMPDAEAIVDMIAQSAHDTASEAAEDYPDLTPEAIEELDTLLTAWAAKHLGGPCVFWIADGSPEEIKE